MKTVEASTKTSQRDGYDEVADISVGVHSDFNEDIDLKVECFDNGDDTDFSQAYLEIRARGECIDASIHLGGLTLDDLENMIREAKTRYALWVLQRTEAKKLAVATK